MLRRILVAALIGTSFAAAPAFAEIETYFGFQVGIRNAPPPPMVAFEAEPKLIRVPESRVYVVRRSEFDRDLFHYGGAWFLYSDGFWYRGSSYSGPFRALDVRVVPSAVLRVPPQRWKHHPHGGPPGLARKASHGPSGGSVAVKDKHRGKGRGR